MCGSQRIPSEGWTDGARMAESSTLRMGFTRRPVFIPSLGTAKKFGSGFLTAF